MQIEQGLLETLQTLIDNRAGNQMLEAVRPLMRESVALDLATGYLELGAMLALDGDWQRLHSIRLLMGDEVTRKTKEVILQALTEKDRNGIEQAKEEDDWKALDGLEAIKAALQNGTIDARVYTRAKFHAKALHFKTGGVVNHGIIGSSNFTRKGLTENLELNLFTSDNAQLKELERSRRGMARARSRGLYVVRVASKPSRKRAIRQAQDRLSGHRQGAPLCVRSKRRFHERQDLPDSDRNTVPSRHPQLHARLGLPQESLLGPRRL